MLYSQIALWSLACPSEHVRHEIRRLGSSILKVNVPASLEDIYVAVQLRDQIGPVDDAKLYHKAGYNSPED